jgi:hypothetical protein
VKFAKSSKLTTGGKAIKKSKKIAPKTSQVTTLAMPEMEAPPYYYYYYYPDDTTDELQQQQQQFYYNNNNNMMGNYYYYAFDGTSDANYQPEFFIQPTSVNSENYMR